MSDFSNNLLWFFEKIEKALAETKDDLEFNDLSNQQIYYLQVICQLNNPTLSKVAKKLNLKKPTITVLVNRLSAKGYVNKLVNEKDNRSTLLEVTEKSKKIINLRTQAFNRIVEEISSVLSATELVIFTELLKKFKSNSTIQYNAGGITCSVDLRQTA